MLSFDWPFSLVLDVTIQILSIQCGHWVCRECVSFCPSSLCGEGSKKHWLISRSEHLHKSSDDFLLVGSTIKWKEKKGQSIDPKCCLFWNLEIHFWSVIPSHRKVAFDLTSGLAEKYLKFEYALIKCYGILYTNLSVLVLVSDWKPPPTSRLWVFEMSYQSLLSGW